MSIWSLVRHGKNHPGDQFSKVISTALNIKEDIIASYDNGSSSLCAQDMENLRRWSLDNTMVNKPNELTKEGYEEMYELGIRLKRVFGKLLDKLDKGSYTFRALSADVVYESSKAFLKGLGYENAFVDKSQSEFNVLAVGIVQ